MSYNTKVVIFVGSADPAATARVAQAAVDFAENHARAACFEHISEYTQPYADAGHGEVIVGSVNHLSEDELLGVLRFAACNPAWNSDFAPLTVIFRGDDDDAMPRTRTLDADGAWHGLPRRR